MPPVELLAMPLLSPLIPVDLPRLGVLEHSLDRHQARVELLEDAEVVRLEPVVVAACERLSNSQAASCLQVGVQLAPASYIEKLSFF